MWRIYSRLIAPTGQDSLASLQQSTFEQSAFFLIDDLLSSPSSKTCPQIETQVPQPMHFDLSIFGILILSPNAPSK